MSEKPRVLHSIGKFLVTTENWIYPLVTAVPGVDSAVLCQDTVNLSQFPLGSHSLFAGQSQLWRSVSNLIPNRTIRRLANKGAHRTAELRARRWRPSIVHAHFGMQGWRSLRLAKSLRATLITSFYGHDAWLKPVAQPEWCGRFRELFVHSDLFLVEGSVFRQRLIDLGCPPEKVRIQRLGVDLDGLAYRQRDFTGTLKIAMVGRFVEKKGMPDGLAACLQAARRGVNLKVTIVGDAPSYDMRGQEIKRQLRSLAAEPALAGRVCFTGFLPPSAMFDILKQQNILLCPSKQAANGDAEGGRPFVLAEAMALGIIGIGSRHCDMEDLITNRRTGYLFDECDVHGLVEILCNLPSGGDQLGKIAEAARHHIEGNFDLEQQLTSLGDIYREVYRAKTLG